MLLVVRVVRVLRVMLVVRVVRVGGAMVVRIYLVRLVHMTVLIRHGCVWLEDFLEAAGIFISGQDTVLST